jgi:hypothetical protein
MLLLWVCWNAFIGMDCTGMGHLDWYSIPPLYAGTIPESTYLLFNMHEYAFVSPRHKYPLVKLQRCDMNQDYWTWPCG